MGSEKAILLKDILPIAKVSDYKVHFARNNGNVEPMDSWVSDRWNWVGWQKYRKKQNWFNRPYIFSLMDFYH